MPRVTRAAALERYRELPLPDTTQEAWRFTDLAGFDPDGYGSNGHVQVPAPGQCSTSTWPVWPSSRRAASRSSRRPKGSRSSRSTEHALLGTLVGADDKFTAHNAASWKHGLLVRVPKGVELEQPLYVRIANSIDGRLALLAAARRRRGGLALHADRGVLVVFARPRRLLERRGRALRRAGREARVRVAAEPLARDVALRHAPRARRARRRARLGRRRLRLEEGEDRGSRTTSPARARPRA